MAGDENGEDDYLSMNFTDAPNAATKESSLQRTARLKREAVERGRVLSKAERTEQAKAAREAALSAQLDSSNKGAKLMAKMGFKGGALGAPGNEGRENPIEILQKDDRSGIGVDSEKKRKVREAAEQIEKSKKRTKLTEVEYRERNRLEREEKRAEGQWWGAMKVLEGFDETELPSSPSAVGTEQHEGKARSALAAGKPLRSINLLYRPLIKDRLQKEQERRARNDLQQSLSRNPAYDDSEDREDEHALGDEIEDLPDEEDEELATFEELPAATKLEKTIAYLRDTFHYCFWCKFRYPDEEMEGCPGLTEDEHG